MDKRYQVFVSSTFEDLQEERKEVMQALLELDCIPAGMELFPASNDDQWTLIKRVIDDSDYYLLIIGGRYGSTNKDGTSYTQMEFEYALSKGKPIISFLPKYPEKIPSGKCESDSKKKEKLEAFKDLTKQKLIKYWESPADLGSVVSRSMVRLIKDFPAEGWVKSKSAVDEESLKEISRLRQENKALSEQLQVIATEPPKGTERFAQGEDNVEIGVLFNARHEHDFQIYKFNSILKFKWNELFANVAPALIDEASEEKMIAVVSELIAKKIGAVRNQERLRDLKDFRDCTISEESFGKIKVQFRALGLIQLSSKKRNRSTADTNTYWTLTPYGDFVMTQLVAIKRK